jgi:extradiol dioxygenase family protein
MIHHLTPFHVAIPVRDIPEARHFYGSVLGFPEGRSDERWIDFNMFGHQFVVHLEPALTKTGTNPQGNNPVDGHAVPIPHFGVVLEMDTWESFADRVRNAGIPFVIEPYIRFAGQPGEQATMFFLDPSGNALEFKSFRDIQTQLFAT